MRGRSLLLATLVLSACDGQLSPGPEISPELDCCPAWFGSDSVVVYFDEGVRSRSQRGLWTTTLDRSVSRKLSSEEIYDPTVSSDGTFMAFSRRANIFVAPMSGDSVVFSQARQVTYSGSALRPAISRDGTWIAYLYGDCRDTCGVYVTQVDGTGTRFVVRGVAPTWSVTGDHLVYIAGPGLYRVDVAPASIPELVWSSGSSSTMLYSAQYSPNGQWIMVEVGETPGPTLHAIKFDGSRISKLTHGRRGRWSGSGTRIVFTYSFEIDSRNKGTVWWMDLITRDKHQLTYP
jgi:Tol biopolymer transport system component